MQQDNGVSFEGNQGGNDPKKPPLCMNKEVSEVVMMSEGKKERKQGY